MGLEEVFRKISELIGVEGLDAEIVVQEEIKERILVEEGRYEVEWSEKSDDRRWGPYRVIDTDNVYEDKIVQRRITRPDEKKRAEARNELQELYDSWEWYSGRYEAGIFLGKEIGELCEKINSWIPDLEINLDSSNKREREETIEDISELYSFAKLHELVNLDKSLHYLPVKNLLKSVYKDNEDVDVRRRAGLTLRYSGLRIWLHEVFRSE